jgi:hypothetical protein
MQALPKLAHLIKQVNKSDFQGRLLAVDPGETTGLTIIDVSHPYPQCHNVALIIQDQIPSWPLEQFITPFTKILSTCTPTQIVYEAYHVYRWRLQEHAFSEVPTIQIIGALKTLAIQHKIPFLRQTAQVGKAFFTDQRLKSMDMYIPGAPHSRDSLRHCAHYLTFGPPTSK